MFDSSNVENTRNSPPLLIPAMQIHLFNSNSASPLTRRLCMNKLEFCCVILEEMQNVFDSAAVFRGIFLEAARRIVGRTTTTVNGAHQNDRSHANERPPQAPADHGSGHDADRDAILVPNDEGFNMYDALFGMEDLTSAAGLGPWGNFEMF